MTSEYFFVIELFYVMSFFYGLDTLHISYLILLGYIFKQIISVFLPFLDISMRNLVTMSLLTSV